MTNWPKPEEKRDCVIYPTRIPSTDICFVNTVLDDHEGIAVMRTENPDEGLVEFWVSPDLVDEFLTYINFVREEYDIPITVYDPIPESTEITEFMRNQEKQDEQRKIEK